MALLLPWKKRKVWVRNKRGEARRENDSYTPELEQNLIKPGRIERPLKVGTVILMSLYATRDVISCCTYRAHLKLLWTGEKPVAAIHRCLGPGPGVGSKLGCEVWSGTWEAFSEVDGEEAGKGDFLLVARQACEWIGHHYLLCFQEKKKNLFALEVIKICREQQRRQTYFINLVRSHSVLILGFPR